MFCRHRTPRLSEIFGLVGRCITERCSTDVAAAAASSTSLPLKQLPTKELQQLVQNTKAVKALTPSVRRDIRGDHKVEGLQQWEKLDCRVYQPFIAEDIVKQDVFAVIEAGSTQFKVVADDRIFVHKLNDVEVDDVIQFNKVLLVGTPNDTVVGRPHVQQVKVLGSIEEHIRDATTYVYKRRRAKGYRRFRGFRAELTAVRILGILGTDKYINVPVWDENTSTPLRELPTFGNQVRNRRKRVRAQQVKQARELVQQHLESGSPDQFGVQSMSLTDS